MPPHPALKHPELWGQSCTLQLWDTPWGSVLLTDSSTLGGVHRWLATGDRRAMSMCAEHLRGSTVAGGSGL